MSAFKKLAISLLVVVGALLPATDALASHFRYGNIQWRVPDPVNAPRTVEFKVVHAWAVSPSVNLFYGDGQSSGAGVGTLIGTGVDSSNQSYSVYERILTHTYATAGKFTAFFGSCCRIAALVNASNASFRVESGVDLVLNAQNQSINTGGPVAGIPVIIQFEVGKVNTFSLPVFDPDADPFTCSFSTQAESQIPTGRNPPCINNVGNCLKYVAPGCSLEWNTTGGTAGQKYALSVEVESTNNGGRTMIDYIIELVAAAAAPPSCTGGGNFSAPTGVLFQNKMTATDPNASPLDLGITGAPAGSTSNPVSGTQNIPSPASATFSWTPQASDAGTTRIVEYRFTNNSNTTGSCFMIIQVPTCPNFGKPCSNGVGECNTAGTITCVGSNDVCNAVPGQPTSEVCDGKDNDCDGTSDENNPGSGQNCSSGLPGICDPGKTDCQNGALACVPNVAPGSVTEVCDAVDNDCDGSTDEGFNVGNGCTAGVGECQQSGTIVCDGMGGAKCNAVPGQPSTEVCDAKDNDCDGQTDEGFNLGSGCTAGVGECQASGTIVCDAQGGATCNAVPGQPTAEVCDGKDNDCDGTADQGNPGSGQSCSAQALGECTKGLTTCQNGNLDCLPGQPGAEVCGPPFVDEDCDGDNQTGCADTDGDGITDDVELVIGSDPNDADSDDDGIPDGDEPQSDNPGCKDSPSCFDDDFDGDGLINVLDPDSDNDGLLDGTEVGSDCSGKDTDKDKCVPDGDAGATMTDPLDKDSDDGGVCDGCEDTNLNGVLDGMETDPTAGQGADDSAVVDTDGDGLPDELEKQIGSDPNDADSDDDGLLDGEEPNFNLDSDGDGLINVLDVDSDNDGLYDGTEMGKDCSNPDTDPGPPAHCIADADLGATKTSPILWDTDGGGAGDGSEDHNLNGQLDEGETDPTPSNGADDVNVIDTDGDGLGDELEKFIGSDPNDGDSDDDGLPDGLEANPADDADGDGKSNIADEDSDGDGLFDGTENGLDCENPDTDDSAGTCIPDADAGQTKTHHLKADTDNGGVSDGDEDENKNGQVDGGEKDPNDPLDDNKQCLEDGDCPADGTVCDPDTNTCVEGCKNGTGCGEGECCSSTDESVGTCEPCGTGGSGGTGTGGGGGAGGAGGAAGGGGGGVSQPVDLFLEGGCECRATPGGATGAGGAAWLLAVLGLGGALSRRRRAA